MYFGVAESGNGVRVDVYMCENRFRTLDMYLGMLKSTYCEKIVCQESRLESVHAFFYFAIHVVVLDFCV